MCKFLSAVFLKSGEVLCDPEHTDSHKDLLAASNVNDGEASYCAGNICRVEFTPPRDFEKVSNLSLWTLCVDEKNKPGWFDKVKARENIEGRVRRMIVTDAQGTLIGGCWIFDGDKASLEKLVNGRVVGIANGAILDHANLDHARLDHADLDGASLVDSNLVGANLVDASLVHANLDGARLVGASLDHADLDGASLVDANLVGANLAGASLDHADLVCASLVDARLDGASLVHANLDHANLDHANLVGANLDHANLDGADLDGARLDHAIGLRLPPGWELVDGIARRTHDQQRRA